MLLGGLQIIQSGFESDYFIRNNSKYAEKEKRRKSSVLNARVRDLRVLPLRTWLVEVASESRVGFVVVRHADRALRAAGKWWIGSLGMAGIFGRRSVAITTMIARRK